MAAGRLAEAADAFRAEGRIVVDQQALTLYLSARPALWLGDREGADAADLADLDATGLHGPVVENRRATMHAGLLALDGRTAEAVALYRDVAQVGRSWPCRRQGHDGDRHGHAGRPWRRRGRARRPMREKLLRRVGATPFLERLDVAMAAPTSRASSSVAAATDQVATAAGTSRP